MTKTYLLRRCLNQDNESMIKKIFAKHCCLIVIGIWLYLVCQSSFAASDFVMQFLSEEERAFIKNHPVIIVGGEKDWTPFDFVNAKGEYSGICNDYLKLISTKTGLQFKIEIDGWAQLLKKMDEGKIDLLPAIYRNKERMMKYHFTSSYHQVMEYVFAREGVIVNKPEDLFGKTIAIVESFATVSFLKEHYPKINILEVPSVDAAIDAVITGKADFLFDSLAAMSYSLQQKSITHIRPVFPLENYQLQKLYMASRQDLPLLAGIISKVFDSLDESEKQQLLQPWLGQKNWQPNIQSEKIQLGLTEQEKAYLANHPILLWGYDIDWAPIEYFDKRYNKVTGIAADYMLRIQELLGVQIKAIPPDTWSNMLLKMQQHKINVLSAVAKTTEREKYMQFTKPHISFPMVIISKEERPYISHLTMLSGLTVAVVKNYMSYDIIKEKYPELKLLVVDNSHKGLLAVAKDEADVFVGNLATSSHVISHSGLTNLKIIGQTSYNYDLALGVPKNEVILRDILQKALNQISEEEANAIYQKWLRVTYKYQFDFRIVGAILLGAILIVALFLYWNRKLILLNRTINNYVNIIDTHVITASINSKGTIDYVSDAFCHATGYEREDLLGKNYSLFQKAEIPEKFYKNLWQDLAAFKTWKGDVKIKHRQGYFFWLQVTITPKLKGESYSGYTAICHDITDKKSLEKRTITDELTGLYNRRHFNALFAFERNRARRENKVFAFFMLDIDNFKKYNDNYGHQKGDDALIAVAQLLKNTLKRSSDKAFRLGGEEFGCLVAVNSMSEISIIAEKIRITIEAAAIEHLANLPYKVLTTSIGVYTLLPKDQNEQLEFVYRQADQRLYKAKHKGRNRVEM